MSTDDSMQTMSSGSGNEDTEVDLVSLFRGTATVTFMVQLVSLIGIVGSLIAYYVSRPGGLIENIETDVAVFLFLVGAMIALFIFLATIGFFVRFNRRLGRFVVREDLDTIDVSDPGAKTVIAIYGLAVGLILIMGMYGYWLVFKYYLRPVAATSLSFMAFTIALGVFVLTVLIEVVLVALGRTASGIVRKVLAPE